jgi:hypothetical protein
MVLDVFKDISKIIDFKSIIRKPEDFYKLDDNFLWRLDHHIIERIKSRKFYKHLDDFIEADKNDITSIKESYGDNLIIHNLKFGYEKEIFDNIFFYKINKDTEKFKKIFRDLGLQKIIRLITK